MRDDKHANVAPLVNRDRVDFLKELALIARFAWSEHQAPDVGGSAVANVITVVVREQTALAANMLVGCTRAPGT